MHALYAVKSVCNLQIFDFPNVLYQVPRSGRKMGFLKGPGDEKSMIFGSKNRGNFGTNWAGTNWLVLIAASSKLTAELTGYADHKSESASPNHGKTIL